MAALSDPAVTIASMRTVAVCTTCARRLIDKGNKPCEGSIALGELCECHPVGQHPIQATSLVVVPASEVTTPTDLGIAVDLDEEDPDPFAQEAREIMREAATAAPTEGAPTLAWGMRGADVGPVTEIATRLLVAWSSAERVADAMMIDAAIHAARALLKKTGGR